MVTAGSILAGSTFLLYRNHYRYSYRCVPTLWTNTTCQYATAVVTGGLSSCTQVTQSPGPTNYTVAQG